MLPLLCQKLVCQKLNLADLRNRFIVIGIMLSEIDGQVDMDLGAFSFFAFDAHLTPVCEHNRIA